MLLDNLNANIIANNRPIQKYSGWMGCNRLTLWRNTTREMPSDNYWSTNPDIDQIPTVGLVVTLFQKMWPFRLFYFFDGLSRTLEFHSFRCCNL